MPNHNLDVFLKLVLAQMVVDGLSTSSIQFFLQALPYLQGQDGISCSDLARQIGMTMQSARRHIGILCDLSYTERINYRRWRVVDDPIYDKDLYALKKLAVDSQLCGRARGLHNAPSQKVYGLPA